MRFLKVKDLKPKSMEQLKVILAERQEQLRRVRFQVSSKEIKNHRELRFLRKEIARIQTVITDKQEHPEPAPVV
ncbi:MAG: 50S ribosomal protein L29 [Patescibacteria group bacterium]